MRFPYKAYADMVAQEEKSKPRQVAKSSAGEKKTISESAIEDGDETTEHDDIDDVSGSDDENLVD